MRRPRSVRLRPVLRRIQFTRHHSSRCSNGRRQQPLARPPRNKDSLPRGPESRRSAPQVRRDQRVLHQPARGRHFGLGSHYRVAPARRKACARRQLPVSSDRAASHIPAVPNLDFRSGQDRVGRDKVPVGRVREAHDPVDLAQEDRAA